jgi:hypothetical protein
MWQYILQQHMGLDGSLCFFCRVELPLDPAMNMQQ